MRLDSITAINYRTFQNITLTFAKNYCTVSGRNNAGKSCVIRLLSALFRSGTAYPWATDTVRFDYKEDRTQWIKQQVPIRIEYVLGLTKEEDPALLSFIEKIASKRIEQSSASIRVSYTVSETDGFAIAVAIDKEDTDEKAAKEIDKRIKPRRQNSVGFCKP